MYILPNNLYLIKDSQDVANTVLSIEDSYTLTLAVIYKLSNSRNYYDFKEKFYRFCDKNSKESLYYVLKKSIQTIEATT